MKTNSLAFRLFVTAAAWVLLVLPIAGGSSISRYRHEVDDQLRPPHHLLADRRHQRRRSSTARTSPATPKDWGEGLFEITHSGWYWQIKPLDGRPGRQLRSRSLAGDDHAAAERAQRRAQREGGALGQPRSAPASSACASPRPIYVFGEGKTAQRYSVAVAGTLSEVEDEPGRLPHASSSRRWRWPASACWPSRCSRSASACSRCRKVEQGLAAIRSGEATRLDGDLPAGDQAAAAGAQRAAQVQPGDRRARAHPRRQPRARAQDAARRHHQRGARRSRRRSPARSPSRPTS